ncbi:MAG: TolC family protein [Myxococcales bacterium]|nr:MAG: TolC family protein [Myxococcales bacterium]
MNSYRLKLGLLLACHLLFTVNCSGFLLQGEAREANRTVPSRYGHSQGAAKTNAQAGVAAQKHWDAIFFNRDLKALIYAALKNNQELNIRIQEIIIAKSELSSRRGEYLPKVNAVAGSGIEKVGKHTSQGVSDETHGVSENLADFNFGLAASWELDVWGKLRNAAQAADYRYLASIEAKNFLVTELIAEIANSYYDLVALDNQLEVVSRNIKIQENALEVVKLKQQAARATMLAVQKFEAEVLKNQGRKFALEQERVQIENRINFLVGRYPQPIARTANTFMDKKPVAIATGIPSQLLENRPDVRQAILELEAAKLDVQVAKARFLPRLSLEAGVGYESFNAKHLVATPASLIYNLAGNLVAPLLNVAAIKADYRSANARQIQAVINFERTLLKAFTEVSNQLAKIDNYEKRYDRVSKQVKTLEDAIEMSNVLYQSARADYMEVLMTRRDALEAEVDLIETKKQQMQAMVGVYQALGGGWQRKAKTKKAM